MSTTTTERGEQTAPTPRVLFDEDGFLSNHTLWSEGLGEAIAVREGVGVLGPDHWQVLRHVRERFLTLGGVPNMRRVCRATGLSKEAIYGLFGGCLSLWRIAGLPNPGEEARAYLG
jgi:tRNA 2-thiouridine synthesizing protein E